MANISATLGDDKNLKDYADEAILGLSIADPKSLDFAALLATRSKLSSNRGDYYGAELALRRSIGIQKDFGRPRDLRLAGYQSALARLYSDEDDPAAALEMARPAAVTLTSSSQREWTAQKQETIKVYLSALHRQYTQSPTADQTVLLNEAFEVSQWQMMNQAGQALDAATRRAALGDAALGAILQKRIELARQQDSLDAKFADMLATVGSHENSIARDAVNAQIVQLDEDLRQVNRSIDPKLMELSDPKPVSLETVRDDLLTDSEALLSFNSSASDTYAWLVTKQGTPRWERVSLDAATIDNYVQTLRCGLDRSQRDPDPGNCLKLVGRGRKGGERDPLPFRLDIASELYQNLLGRVDGYRKI